MSVPQADGQYDYTQPPWGWNKPWQLLSETIAAERTWENNGPPWSPPVTPVPDAHEMVPPRFGYREQQLTIYDVLDNVFSRLQDSPVNSTPFDDFSGTNGSYDGTMRPVSPGGGGIT